MQRRKVDNRIRVLIENGVAERQRGLFVVVGDRGKDQVSASWPPAVAPPCREGAVGLNRAAGSPPEEDSWRKAVGETRRVIHCLLCSTASCVVCSTVVR